VSCRLIGWASFCRCPLVPCVLGGSARSGTSAERVLGCSPGDSWPDLATQRRSIQEGHPAALEPGGSSLRLLIQVGSSLRLLFQLGRPVALVPACCGRFDSGTPRFAPLSGQNGRWKACRPTNFKGQNPRVKSATFRGQPASHVVLTSFAPAPPCSPAGPLVSSWPPSLGPPLSRSPAGLPVPSWLASLGPLLSRSSAGPPVPSWPPSFGPPLSRSPAGLPVPSWLASLAPPLSRPPTDPPDPSWPPSLGPLSSRSPALRRSSSGVSAGGGFRRL